MIAFVQAMGIRPFSKIISLYLLPNHAGNTSEVLWGTGNGSDQWCQDDDSEEDSGPTSKKEEQAGDEPESSADVCKASGLREESVCGSC